MAGRRAHEPVAEMTAFHDPAHGDFFAAFLRRHRADVLRDVDAIRYGGDQLQGAVQHPGATIEVAHVGAVIHHIGGVTTVNLPQHAAVEHFMQPAEQHRLAIGVGDGDIGFSLGRVLADHAAVLADIQHRLAAGEHLPRGSFGNGMRIEAELAHDAHAVGRDPFAVDAVFQHHAIGNGAGIEGAPGGAAIGAFLGVAASAGDEVGAVETINIVAVPDHLRRHTATVWEGGQALNRIAHDIFAAVHGFEVVIDVGVAGVVAVDQADITFVPDAVGAADDVIDDVGVARVEPAQALRARAVGGHEVHEIMPFHMQHLFGGRGGGDDLRRGRAGGLRVAHDASLVLARDCWPMT